MAEAVETFDLGNFEGRMLAAAGGDASLTLLAANIAGISAALFAGASSVSTSASSTIAEKEAQTLRLRDIFVQRVREVLNSVGAAVTEIGNTASSMHQLVGDTEKYSGQVVATLVDTGSNVAGVADGVGRLSESIGKISETVATTAERADHAVAQAEHANTLIHTLAQLSPNHRRSGDDHQQHRQAEQSPGAQRNDRGRTEPERPGGASRSWPAR